MGNVEARWELGVSYNIQVRDKGGLDQVDWEWLERIKT